jgi:hypothetical protein
MAKVDQLARTLEQLRAVEADPHAAGAAAVLNKAVTAKSNLVVARAAKVVKQARLESFVPTLTFAFDRFMVDPAKADPGCSAKSAIADALYDLEANAEGLFLRGIHHRQSEGVWGGSVDTAAELRGTCALGLVRMNYREVMDELAALLVDPEPTARAMAAQAVAYTGDDRAAPLLRLKLLSGDANVDVMAEGFTGLMKLTPAKGVAFVAERFAESSDKDLAQAALLALGSSRLPAAFEWLRGRFDGQLIGDRKKPYLLPIALTRLAAAIDFLVDDVIRHAHPSVAAAALEAVKIHLADPKLRDRVRAVVKQRGDATVTRALASAEDPGSDRTTVARGPS